jgi:mRNA-degrading endonuclease RelE of RelBE toxin-antitoxin system
MNAVEIIDEIKHLPPSEQQRVVEFVHTLQRRPWSGEKLTEYEKRLVETNDPAEAQRLKEQIVAGFYGGRAEYQRG